MPGPTRTFNNSRAILHCRPRSRTMTRLSSSLLKPTEHAECLSRSPATIAALVVLARILPGRAIDPITQARKAPGFRQGLTSGGSQASLLDVDRLGKRSRYEEHSQFRSAQGSHGKLPGWCDEAAVAHYQADELPPWTEAWERLKAGRFLSVQRPSADQLAKQISAPRTQPLIQRSI